jgi:hypothetical protein
MTDDLDIHRRITSLVDEERALRAQLAGKEISATDEHQRLSELESQLDQCWDLLRQRDALRDAGGNPDAATPRSPSVVEHYLE